MRKAFFVGIGGIGMSALARLYHANGYVVSGSDRVLTLLTAALDAEGITVVEEVDAQLPEGCTEVVYSPAVPDDYILLQEARYQGITVRSYPQALGAFTKYFDQVVAIAGTHGKTTTTAMLATICIAAGLDPTVVVGATVKQLDGNNYRVGSRKLCIIEACEYKHSFLEYFPTHTVITNVEPDHLDFFKTSEAYYDAFHQLIGQTKERVLCLEDTVTTLGQHPKMMEVALREHLEVGVPGAHNRANASLAYGIARELGVSDNIIRVTLREFHGTDRRFDHKGTMDNGALLYDDYAHHPTEIRATLKAFRETYPNKKLVVVFQPHQYSRTIALIDQFATAFTDSDVVIVPDIYGVRDSAEDQEAMSVATLVEAISMHHQHVYNGEGQQATIAYVKEYYDTPDHVVILMGAGNVTNMAVHLLGWKQLIF